jgi:hypothetical protein
MSVEELAGIVRADVEAALKAGKRAHRKPPKSHGWNRNRE